MAPGPQKSSGLLKFSKRQCLWNPEDAANPKVSDSYSYLDLHINQFLSHITEDYTFLPNSIYKPAIHVLINGRLVYKTKVLDFGNDVFDETIRLKIYSPDTVVTLRLFECEEFNATKSEELDLKPIVEFESTSLVLISWVDLDVGLLVPERDYKMVFTFKSNPAFTPYNPGGILYYPTRANRPAILSKRVCSACKVCALLAHQAVGADEGYQSLSRYFDYKFVDSLVESSESGEATPSRGLFGSDKEDSELDLVEVIDMTSNKRSRGAACSCAQLRAIPAAFQKNKHEVCLKCHDYEVCCDHSLNNYYLSLNLKLVPSGERIDVRTELFALLLSREPEEPRQMDLASIFELYYQQYFALELVFKHL